VHVWGRAYGAEVQILTPIVFLKYFFSGRPRNGVVDEYTSGGRAYGAEVQILTPIVF